MVQYLSQGRLEIITMTMEEKIARINELYHKSKETGLTEEEKEEQGRLRWDYINSIKAGIGAHLDNMSIKYSDGTIKKVKKTNIIQDK